MRDYETSDLNAKDIPPSDASWEDIWRLALTFNGYQHWGSFEKCVEVANQERDTTLVDLRTCLFFEFQRWRHFGENPDEDAES